MALPQITYKVTDRNLFRALAGEDHISALVFDVATFPTSTNNTGSNGDVYEVFSFKEAEDLGFKAFDSVTPTNNYENGVPHYHIKEFFRINPNGQLFIGVRDITADGDFSFLSDVQKASQGKIRQIGVYTKQDLWLPGAMSTDPYTPTLTGAIQSTAESDAALNQPYSVLLHANTSSVGGIDVDRSLIPTVLGSDHRVTVLIGQGNSDFIKDLQSGNEAKKATIGTVGTALGIATLAKVHESIGWVNNFNVGGTDLDTIAFGFGSIADESPTSKRLADSTNIDALSRTQLDSFENLGYVFPIKYVGRSGTYFTSDTTASTGDYRTFARNRVIDKSRRLVRTALLPTLNQPLYVATDGTLSIATIQQFKSLVSFQLSQMRIALEISDFTVEIDPNQDVLATDKLNIKYRIIPVGVNKEVEVEIGLAASTSQ
ncbi:MAG: DUF2586 family protein [Bacteroidota bacterium]